jgi:hypothetical protein
MSSTGDRHPTAQRRKAGWLFALTEASQCKMRCSSQGLPPSSMAPLARPTLGHIKATAAEVMTRYQDS